MRDKLIELLSQSLKCKGGICFECECFNNIEKCIKRKKENAADYLIAHGVTFATDNNVGKWIPVSERLPDANGVYLSVDDMGIYSFRVFDPNKRMWKAIWEDEKVTHWMPLPEPPKEGE